MRVLLIGRWGKAHAIARALAQSRNIELYSFMDKLNNGIADLSVHYKIGDITDLNQIDHYAKNHKIEMIVITSEMSLLKGASNHFNEEGIPTIGASALCAWLEADKSFLRSLMRDFYIDASPRFKVFYDEKKAADYIRKVEYPVAIKPAGITPGDGVKVMGMQLRGKDDAIEYVEEIFKKDIGKMPCIVIEEKIVGEEYTIQVFSDGKTIVPLPAVKDYKLLNEGDTGLNTPGMGSFSDTNHFLPFLDQQTYDDSLDVIKWILLALKEQYSEKYKGFLSAQFMLTELGIKLIEINVSPGDSEILNVLPLLKNDFLEVCKAMAEERLHELDIQFEHKATVCKYVVPEGFPSPRGYFEVYIDRQKLEKTGAHLTQACFQVANNIYEPSPRLFAITGIGDTLEQANLECEEGLSCIRGNRITYRKDIGTPVYAALHRDDGLVAI